jgi:hypothetical protein
LDEERGEREDAVPERLVLRRRGTPGRRALVLSGVCAGATLVFFTLGGGYSLAIAVFALITAIRSLLRGEAGLELRFEPERFVLAGTPIPWAAIRDARARRRGVRASVDLYVGPAPGHEPPRSGMWTIYPGPYGKEPEELAEMILAYRDRATGQVAGP